MNGSGTILERHSVSFVTVECNLPLFGYWVTMISSVRSDWRAQFRGVWKCFAICCKLGYPETCTPTRTNADAGQSKKLAHFVYGTSDSRKHGVFEFIDQTLRGSDVPRIGWHFEMHAFFQMNSLKWGHIVKHPHVRRFIFPTQCSLNHRCRRRDFYLIADSRFRLVSVNWGDMHNGK